MSQTISVGFFQGSVLDPAVTDINALVIKVMEAGNVKVTNVKSRAEEESGNDDMEEFDRTLEIAMENIEVCEQHDFDYIVNTIGGSGMALKEYDKLFVPGTVWYDRAKKFTDKVRNISDIMDMADLQFKHEVGRTAVYQSPGKKGNEPRIFEEPVEIIKQIPGLHYIETKNYESESAKPDLIITSNLSCHSQINSGVGQNRTGDQIEIKHIVEVVAESCGIASNQ